MPDPTGLSGKKLTIATVLGLVLVGATLAYVLWVYSELDQAREQSESAWRTLATELDERYRQIESKLTGDADVGQIGELKAAVGDFRSLTRRRTQQASALAVEQLLAATPELRKAAAGEPPPKLEQALQAFNRSQAEERAILGSIGGRVLDVFLSFAEPDEFVLAQ